MSTQKWYREVARELDELGITYSFETGRKHTKVYIERGAKKGVLVISASPSDVRSLKNMKSIAKRLVW